MKDNTGGMIMVNDNEIMKFEEVMEYLNIGKSTLYKLLRNGDIQSFNSAFLFCGRRRDRLKILLWEDDGFLL